MFTGDDQLKALTEKVGPLEFALQIPEARARDFKREGILPTTPDDLRRFQRAYFHTNAALLYRTTLPALPRPPARHRVVTADISRNGIMFLHSEQLFPNERMTLVLSDLRSRLIEVARCRWIGEACFEIGAVYVSRLASR